MHAVVVISLLVVVILINISGSTCVSSSISSTLNLSSSSIHHNNNGSSSWRLLHAIVAVENSLNTIIPIIATASYPSLAFSLYVFPLCSVVDGRPPTTMTRLPATPDSAQTRPNPPKPA